MGNAGRSTFFDQIAEQWDSWEDLSSLRQKLASGLEELKVCANETVLDIGCGTGNLTQAILDRLSSEGRIIAVDISPRMIAQAQQKVTDFRATWYLANAECLPIPDASCDRVFCYSVWPHFDRQENVLEEFYRVLRPGGFLHIWHLLSREKINEIHASASEIIRQDILPPAKAIVDMLGNAGFQVTTSIDDQERYLVTAARAGK